MFNIKIKPSSKVLWSKHTKAFNFQHSIEAIFAKE